MNSLVLYLTFNGNCREAMTFYQQCFGGLLSLQSIAESPMSEKFPPSFTHFILQASLRKENFVLMGSDLAPDERLKKGNALSILIEGKSEEEIREYYEKLSEGGKITHPLSYNFHGALFGGLTDRFGIQWLFNFLSNQDY